mgnify:CR=1 FL=1
MEKLELLAAMRQGLMLNEADVMHPIKHRLGHYYCPNCGAGEHSKTGAIPHTPSPRPDSPTPKLQKCYGCSVRLRTPHHLLKQERELHSAMRSNPAAQTEGKDYKTPEFVRHCVTAITERPKDLARVESGRKGDGSPFGICWSKYNKNKSSLDARHSTGEHHTNKEYEQALSKLREATEQLRAERPKRTAVAYAPTAARPARELVSYRSGTNSGSDGSQ